MALQLRRFFRRSFTSTFGSKFRIDAACILHRPPITMRKLNAFEREYEAFRLMLEGEQSRGIFRIGTVGGIGNVEEALDAKSEEEDGPLDGTEVTDRMPTAPHEMAEAEIFKTSGYPEDSSSLPSSDLRRHLDKKLYFVVREGADGYWRFPSASLEPADIEGLGLDQVSKQSIAQILDSKADAQQLDADIYWIGKAPVAVHQEMFEGRIRAPFGVKTFFFPARLLAGSRFAVKVDQFAWLSKGELEGGALDPALYESIKAVLSE